MYFLATLLLVSSFFSESVFGYGRFGNTPRERHARRSQNAARQIGRRGQPECTSHNYRFLNNKTSPYLVKSLPEVDFALSEMYSGLIPIDTNNASRALFFVFAPKVGDSVDEVTIWLNGGPGCSSLEGFFQENGPILWYPGTVAPVQNPYSWTNLTNMLWVEQPVGTGFSIGTPTATTQEETAQDFIKFFKNFQDLFGIKNFKIYVTGESYAGRYVPYISAAMLNENNTEYYNLSGALMYDPCIGEFVSIQEEYTAVPFAKEYNNILNLNDSLLAQVEGLQQTCGYADYLDKYFTFPASGVQPPLYFNFTSDADCDIFDIIFNAAFTINTCFDPYQIVQMCPLLSDVLEFPTFLFQDQYPQPYFNRTDVKEALHAPEYVDWTVCSNEPVYVGGDEGPQGEGDTSADPIQHVLPQVIEATNRVLVSNADFDYIIITDGTLLAIQNMTWNGGLGFKEKPNTPIVVELPDLLYAQVLEANDVTGIDDPQGVMGVQHFERGLMWAETYQAGHMQPGFQGRVTYIHLEWLLGRRDTL